MMNAEIIHQIEFRLIECGIHRVLACIDQLSEDQLQYRPNNNSNSINNQILHLDGNVRQWLISTVLDISDSRKRKTEFDKQNVKSKEILIQLLKDLERDVRSTFPTLSNADLNEMKSVQCYNETLLSIVIHVIEHFSYHLGQITYITKMLKDIDIGYYSGMDLDKVN